MAIPVHPPIYDGSALLTVGGQPTEIVNDQRIIDWIKSLSPAGATQYETDWAEITPVAVLTGTVKWSRIGRQVFLWYDLNGSIAGDTIIVTLPTVIRPAQLQPATEYQYGTTGNRPGYLSLDSLRIPGQPGTTRRIGHVSYRVG